MMRKISLLLIALLILGYLTTNNSEDIRRSGRSKQAHLMQSAGNATSFTTHTSDDRMTQQTDVSRIGSNSIGVAPNETGNVNNGITPNSNKNVLLQKSAENFEEISQSGIITENKFSSHVLLTQMGSFNQSVQSTYATDQQNLQTAIAIQVLNKNELYQYSGGSSTFLLGMTLGNGNKLSQISYGNLDRSVAIVTGDHNLTDLIQRNGDMNTVNLLQTGGSYSYVLQEGTSNRVLGPGTNLFASFTGTGTTLDVIQNNDNNSLELLSNGSTTVFQNGSDYAIVNETGSGTVYINQLSDYNLILINHTGSGLSSYTQLTDVENQIKLNHDNQGNADIVQDGGNNIVSGSTTAFTSTDAGGNNNQNWSYASAAHFSGDRLEVDQIGNYNRLQLNANGNVDVRQNGISNLANVMQSAF